MRTRALLLLWLPLLASGFAAAQLPTEWHDALADHLAGRWKVEGNVMGKDAHHEIQADWVLNHQFLRIHEQTAATAPKGERPYEAVWYLGYDSTSQRYVLHLMDIFGAQYSETLGFGVKDGNQIRFVFNYPDGPFHTTYRWNPDRDTWEWLMEQKAKDGKWSPFADLKLTLVSH